MCLIAYSPKGAPLSNRLLKHAYRENPDGIGVMSALGIQWYIGAGALKKARRYLRHEVEGRALPYAVHWRWATHGDVTLDNVHPFALPNEAGWLMHNGVISWCGYDRDKSDTRTFCDMLDDHPGKHDDDYVRELADLIGDGNKLCILNADMSFSLVNEDAGIWIDGIWYSNTYSLPADMVPIRHFSRLWASGVYSGGGAVPRGKAITTVYNWPSVEQNAPRGEDCATDTTGWDAPDYAEDDGAELAEQEDDRQSLYLDDTTYDPMQRGEEIHTIEDYYRSLERAETRRRC